VVGLQASVADRARPSGQIHLRQRGAAPIPAASSTTLIGAATRPAKLRRLGAWLKPLPPELGIAIYPAHGTEVLVDFIDSDIDRPVIVAQLYTGIDEPPYSAGVDSGANHAGVLSGIHSNNFDGRGYSQWQIDDTQSQLRMRLASSTSATQLNLGYLIEQAPGSAQRGNYRGSGFELRTDAWAMIRGGDGVLISTTARAGQGCGIGSTQMDAQKRHFEARTTQRALSERRANRMRW
jgi:type VI secretion system secreted protein VgrG